MSLNKFTDVSKGKDLNLQIGCDTFECNTCICNNIVVPQGGDITAHSIYVQTDLKVKTSNGDLDYTTPDLGEADYSLHTDGLGNVFWAPDEAGNNGITFNGLAPVTNGQHLKFSSTSGQTANTSKLIEDASNLNIQSLNITNCGIVNSTTIATPILKSTGNLSFQSSGGVQLAYIEDGPKLLHIPAPVIDNRLNMTKAVSLAGSSSASPNQLTLLAVTDNDKLYSKNNTGDVFVCSNNQSLDTTNSVSFSSVSTPSVILTSNGNITNLQTNDTQIKLGLNSGTISQGARAIAIGEMTGNDTQLLEAVAIGSYCASERQGAGCVAIGANAGYSDQQANSVAIGKQSGQITQGTNSVALGSFSGNTNQSSNAISIGTQSGQNNQGANAISIGYQAGINNQHTNSIILNSNSVSLNSTSANQIILQAGTNKLQYDSTGGLSYEGTTVPTSGNLKVYGGAYIGMANRPILSAGYSATDLLGITIANTNVETSLVGSGVGTLTIPANTFRIGAISKSYIAGEIDTGANGETITFRIYSNAVLLGTVVVDLGLNITAGSGFILESSVTCLSLGIGGNLRINTSFRAGSQGNSVVSRINYLSATIDTTIPQTFSATAQWTNALLTNTLTRYTFHTYNAFYPM